MRKLFFLIIPFSLIFISCNHSGKNNNDKTVTRVNPPDFNEDTAWFYVKAQIDFGPRVCNTPAHDKCAEFLASRLKSWADEVKIQRANLKAYNGTILKAQNIIASFQPGNPNRILLSSHWDSRPYADHDPNPANHSKPIDGANDGASGVGVLMEVARQLSIAKPGIGVDIIFWDAEDYGEPQEDQGKYEDAWCLGSQYWAKNPHKEGYRARFGILLDMVGAEDATFMMEGISMHYAPDIVKKVWDIANELGFSQYFVFTQADPITDDHYYINKIAGIPTIDIIHLVPGSSNGFFPYWHTTRDNIDIISKKTLKAVGQTVLEVIVREAPPA